MSDDNSSVQSSPWQRDHCWKQNTPRQGINKELTFSMQALPHMRHLRNLPYYSHKIQKKRRCPYVPIEVTVTNTTFTKCNRLTKSERRDRRKLSDIVQTLLDRVRGPSNSGESVVCSSSFVVNHAKTVSVASGRMDPSIISPRKRILREMERVSLEDLGNSKRQRARSTSALPHNNNNNGSSGNCTATCSTPSQLSVKGSVSNYSITSLLGPNREEELAVTGSHESDSSFLRTLLKSSSQQSSVEQTPKSKSNVKSSSSRKTSPTTQQSSPQISSPSNQASPTLSPSPESLHSGMRNPIVPSIGSSPHLTPFLPHSLMYPPLSSSYIPHPSPAISHLPYYSSRSPVPASYRGPPSPVPSFWVHYPFSSLPRGGMPYGLMGPCQTPSPHVLSQCPWGPISHQQADDFKKEDSNSGKKVKFVIHERHACCYNFY